MVSKIFLRVTRFSVVPLTCQPAHVEEGNGGEDRV